ncbi:MAG: hypothetical protein A3G81_34215 [Betaproteobacteria bacterium RIFCSPLOWO2_12_FULL_65_14]|nr:MAG: hypothetical protein A3G81_34215 [Betaproteobacteria bacterium RIFCSPLOWO2_12_FULL_65_14]
MRTVLILVAVTSLFSASIAALAQSVDGAPADYGRAGTQTGAPVACGAAPGTTANERRAGCRF